MLATSSPSTAESRSTSSDAMSGAKNPRTHLVGKDANIKAGFLADLGAGREPLTITPKQGCWALNIGSTKMYELINAGIIETISIGGRGVRLKYQSVKQFAENGVP